MNARVLVGKTQDSANWNRCILMVPSGCPRHAEGARPSLVMVRASAVLEDAAEVSHHDAMGSLARSSQHIPAGAQGALLTLDSEGPKSRGQEVRLDTQKRIDWEALSQNRVLSRIQDMGKLTAGVAPHNLKKIMSSCQRGRDDIVALADGRGCEAWRPTGGLCSTRGPRRLTFHQCHWQGAGEGPASLTVWVLCPLQAGVTAGKVVPELAHEHHGEGMALKTERPSGNS